MSDWIKQSMKDIHQAKQVASRLTLFPSKKVKPFVFEKLNDGIKIQR